MGAAACGQFAGCCKGAVDSVEEAGSEIGTSLLKKGKSMSGQAGSRILGRVESTFDDKVDKIISEKLLERCDTTFTTAIDTFVDKAFKSAMETFDPAKGQSETNDDDDDSPADEASQRKKERVARLEKSRERLRDYGLPQLLIDRMEQEGWLDERNWEILTKDQLLAMGFCDGHIELFMEGINKNKQAKKIASDKLTRWGIPQFLINRMNVESYLDEARWEQLRQKALLCEREAVQRRHDEANAELKAKEAEDKAKEEEKMSEKIPPKQKRKRGKKSKERNLHSHMSHATVPLLDSPKPKPVPKKQYTMDYPYYSTDLHRIGFEYEHIESFLHGMQVQEETNRPPEFILLESKIPQEVIDKMRKHRVLSQKHWPDLTKQKLTKMGLKTETLRSNFANALAKVTKNKKAEYIDATTQAEQAIRSWGIPPVLVDRMKEVGWIHPEYWDDLLEHEYELQELGFQNGHISTFKRKFQQWKENQDSKATQRKMKLLRKLEKPPKKQSGLLKRNIDIFNAMDEPVKVRIISERKYGSMESTSGSNSQQKDKATSRRQGSSMSSKNKSVQDSSNESTSDTTKERSFKGGASAQVSATPVNASLSVDMSKKDTSSKTSKSAQHSENEREAQRQSNDERSNKMSDATAVSQANTSQHSWDKVKVGFTSVMPNQTIEFPVQISDPNAVVYMTIYSLSGRAPICDNVQIDANYIKIDKVHIDSFGTKVRWQPGVKPAKSKRGAGYDKESIAAKNGIFTIQGFCHYLEKQGIEGKKIKFIKNMLGNAEYDVTKKKVANDEPLINLPQQKEEGEMDHLTTQLEQVLQIYNKKQGINPDDEAKRKYELNKTKQSNDLIEECIDGYLSATLQKTIIKYDDDATAEEEEKAKNKNFKRIDSLLHVDNMCLFLKNKGIAPNKKIEFIQESLGGYGATYIVTKDTHESLRNEVKRIIEVYDKLTALKKSSTEDITLVNYTDRIEAYTKIILEMKAFHEEHAKHSAKYEPFRGHRDDDSDDEELHAVEKFFDCDSHALLEAWGLSQFHERMADEGWQNPLDWVHLDENILKQNIGFRPGHIQIFNRKFDLWVKRYNDVRRTIDPKQKGKHGVLIVGKNETTTLKSNFLYIFTKVIIREGGTLTVKPWSPTQQGGGVLFIQCHQDIILEKNAKISVDGKGYWGSATPDIMGFGPGGGGATGFACNGAGGASYASEGYRGYNLAQDEDLWSKDQIEKYGEDDKDQMQVLLDQYGHLICWEGPKPTVESELGAGDDDLWNGEEGKTYWDCGEQQKEVYFSDTRPELREKEEIQHLECLAIDKRKSFGGSDFANQEAKLTHRQALGSGGGCGIEIYKANHGWSMRPKRGGAGGGAIRLWCDKLIMYESSLITAKGNFDPYGDPFSAGGSGGSIFITVTSDIIPKNRNPHDRNIGLNARGGGQWKMDKMYLPHTWTEKENEAIKKIRTFEKLEYPRLRIQGRKAKAELDEKRRKERDRPDYIDSDDDDDEDSSYWSDDNKFDDDDEEPLKAIFAIDGFCSYLEKQADGANEETDWFVDKENVELIKDRLKDTTWEIEDIDDKFAKEDTLKEMVEKFENVFRDKQNEENQMMMKMKTAKMGKTFNHLAQTDEAVLKSVMHHVKEYYLEQEEAAIEKTKLKKLAISVQIAMIKSEFKEQHKNDEEQVAEEDLWLWKWKKMPKMPKKEDKQQEEADDKQKKKEAKKEAEQADENLKRWDLADALTQNKDWKDQRSRFDAKARDDWEWVGIGGEGVIRVDYHSPFRIGWDRCQPQAHLGTDVGMLEHEEQQEQQAELSRRADTIYLSQSNDDKSPKLGSVKEEESSKIAKANTIMNSMVNDRMEEEEANKSKSELKKKKVGFSGLSPDSTK
eukprot:549816_1